MKRILAISGGGMRGVIPARFLGEIEQRTGRAISGLFDLIAGTSTGAVLAALCVSPRRVSADRALAFYYDAGPRIFRRGMFDYGLVGAKYRTLNLAREVRACIGDAACPDALTKTLIPTTDANAVNAEFIKSWYNEYRDLHLWEAACASSSAQTFFRASP